ncbi:hypothetical protein [Xylophilus ampelinus]|uniref:hypothetical protein n=1 Tax=Xylophilus ampelinus TaxID=54067 RepID=UPI0011B498DC|nr:hypothetical protein [Xylophilus ampelinus]MCS4509950.1 hypothetical protein [Xylophilus ampelinus]
MNQLLSYENINYFQVVQAFGGLAVWAFLAQWEQQSGVELMETDIRFERVQWPVGHGGFHTGRLKGGQANLHYFFDCGATGKKGIELLGLLAELHPLQLGHLEGELVDAAVAPTDLLAVMLFESTK